MTFSDVVGILAFGGGMWVGHWLHRRFGLWGTAIALVASVAVLLGVHWFKGLTGSDERIMATGRDSVAYRVETPGWSFPRGFVPYLGPEQAAEIVRRSETGK